jgi:hypothetical protein
MSAPVTEESLARMEERAIARQEKLFEKLTAALAKAEERYQERHARSEEKFAHNADNFASIDENFASFDIKLNSQEPYAKTQKQAKPDSSEAARAEAQPDVLNLSTTTYSDLPEKHPVFVGAITTLVEAICVGCVRPAKRQLPPGRLSYRLHDDASATERSARADVKLNSQEPFALTQERLEPAKPDSSEAARAEAQPLRQLPPGRLSYRLHDGDAWHDLKARNVMIDPWLPPPWQELSSGNWWLDLF